MRIRLPYWLRKITVYPWQRAVRGYADNDLWNLDNFIVEIIDKSLCSFWSKYERCLKGTACDPELHERHEMVWDTLQAWGRYRAFKDHGEEVYGSALHPRFANDYQVAKDEAFALLKKNIDRLWD